ncbi:MAG TPA: radical SAM protein, partial [Planctomycetota bacterium]|nr:radical SAM protein [Planctomycetota bacterium]
MLARFRRLVHSSPTLQHAVAHARAIARRRQHPEGLPPEVPRRIIVEPTNGCNLRCQYCGNKDMVRPWTYMPMDLYVRMLDEMVELGIPRLTLHTIGEPTLNPRLPEMVEQATERRRCVTLSSNGTLWTEALARRVVRAGPEVLNFSADAAEQAVIDKTREGLDLDKLLATLHLVKRLRDEEGPVRDDTPWGRVQLPTITMTCVLSQHFTRAVEKRYFEVFGGLVDDFLFHEPNNHADYVQNQPFYKPYTLLRGKLRDKLYKRIREPCPYPWDSLYLLSDGSVSVCRFDFDARINLGKYGESNVMDLWQGQKMRSLRRAHMQFDFSEWTPCENCSGTFYENREVHYRRTRRAMRRNGVVPRRDAWLPVNPNRVAIGDPAGRDVR